MYAARVGDAGAVRVRDSGARLNSDLLEVIRMPSYSYRSLLRRKLAQLIMIAAAAVGLTVAMPGGMAHADIPDSDGVYTGCYNSTLGFLRVINFEDGVRCGPFEKRVSWNKEGAAGPQGPQGETGPEGPAGPQGPNLATYVNNAPETLRPGSVGVTPVDRSCDSGDLALGPTHGPLPSAPTRSEPTGTSTWTYSVSYPSSSETRTVTLGVVCADTNQ